jgi:hypothetical protein
MGVKGLSVAIDLRPNPGTWVARLAALRPHPDGYPALPVGPEDLITLRAAIDPEGGSEIVAPIHALMNSLSGADQKSQERNRRVMASYLENLDGTMISTGDPFSGAQLGLTGVTEADALASLLVSEDYAGYVEFLSGISQSQRSTFDPRALQVGDIDVSRKTISDEGRQYTTYSAVAGGYLVTASTPDVEVAKKLIRSAQVGDFNRGKLPEGVLSRLDLRLMDLMDAVSPLGNPLAELGPAAPDAIRFDIGSKNGIFTIRIELN